ncbi:MAG: hypothetical protein QXO32_05405 [Candidatus Bathyarchaeia archaeon]
MSVEEILKVIRSHPEAIAEALEKRPELLTGLMLRLAPWDRFATKEDVKTLLEFMEKRFEDVNRRFEDVNRRFEDVNRRFEDLTRYVDKRVGLVEKLLIGFNVPILIVVITMLIRLFVF